MLRKLLLIVVIALCSLKIYAQNIPGVVINEFMALNATTAYDQDGEANDWVELYNNTDQDINLAGYFLSDGAKNRTKYVFPDTTIAAHAYLIVWTDGDSTSEEGLHTTFTLSSSGDDVVFSAPDTTVLDYIRFGFQFENVSLARFPNGVGTFTPMIAPSFEARNDFISTKKLVINEFMASNDITAFDQDGESNDWVEIYNGSTKSINLKGYFLSDSHKSRLKYVFPDTTMAPDTYLIVWTDGDSSQAGLHTNFKLSSSGDDVILSDSDSLTVDFIHFGPQITDISMGRNPNGRGIFTPFNVATFQKNNTPLVSVREYEESTSIRLFPNPASNVLNLEFDELQNDKLVIYDRWGQIVRVVNTEGISRMQIDVNGLPSGMYVLSAKDFATPFAVIH